MKSARRRNRMRATTLTFALVLMFAACGSDSPASNESVAPTSTVAVPDETAATSTSVVADPATTTTNLVPATTVPTTTPSSALWTDADVYPSGYVMGCCDGNSTGTASPELTASPAPLADGTYAMDVVGWSPEDSTSLQVSVRSLVSCADGVALCFPLPDGTYEPDAVGYSEASRMVEVTLDDSVTVYVAGDDIDVPRTPERRSVLRWTNGNGFAELMTAIANAYEAAIAIPLRAGTTAADIVADLQTNPRSGFSSAAEQATGELYLSFGDAPPVLFQAVANQGEPLERSGTSVLIPRTFTIQNGAISLEFYAGFRS
jgi:hypothetical protein